MSYVFVNPDALNEALLDASGNVVHVSAQADGVHVATYDGSGVITLETVVPVTVDAIQKAIELPAQQLLLVGGSLSTSWVVDTNTHTVNPLDVAVYAAGSEESTITGAQAVLNGQVAVYGSDNGEGWGLLLDFATTSSRTLPAVDAQVVSRVFGFDAIVMEVATEAGREVRSLDADLNEIGRFVLAANLRLIGDSLGNPVLFNSASHDVLAFDAMGEPVWHFENSELETVDGHSVGPDGSVVLWGDNASLNPLVGVVFDNAHLLRIGSDGARRYHYQGGGSMVNILYRNVKQFADGTVQISFQGWNGQLSGFIIGSNLGTPFTVTRQIYHDFVSPAGKKTRWMLEPKRTETYAQCGTLCVSQVSETEGHCDNLDVFNINTQSLVSISQVCGVTDDNDFPVVDVVKVSRY